MTTDFSAEPKKLILENLRFLFRLSHSNPGTGGPVAGCVRRVDGLIRQQGKRLWLLRPSPSPCVLQPEQEQRFTGLYVPSPAPGCADSATCVPTAAGPVRIGQALSMRTVRAPLCVVCSGSRPSTPESLNQLRKNYIT